MKKTAIFVLCGFVYTAMGTQSLSSSSGAHTSFEPKAELGRGFLAAA
jgi:hypothetical protein